MDPVDVIIGQWHRERPDLDVSSMGVIGRLSRLARHLEQGVQENFAHFSLKEGEFDVLAALRRAGAPHRLTPTALYRSLMLSSAAMTHRLDRLESAGLIARSPDPEDRRGVLVGLTAEGLALVDRAVVAHVATQERLLSALTAAEREQLAGLLRKWLASFEAS